MKIRFDLYSPQELRDEIDIEIKKCEDAKQAAYNAVAKLNQKYGVLEKAKDLSRLTKKLITDKNGHQRTVYIRTHKDVKDQRTSQIDTPEFKKWFGNSKVVDKQGKPLVVYHGTDKKFSEFKGDSFFTDSIKGAKKYGKNIIPVYLKMTNPKIIDYDGKDDNDIVFDMNDAKEDGHDGLIVKNTYDGYNTIDQYIIFSPNQIKFNNADTAKAI